MRTSCRCEGESEGEGSEGEGDEDDGVTVGHKKRRLARSLSGPSGPWTFIISIDFILDCFIKGYYVENSQCGPVAVVVCWFVVSYVFFCCFCAPQPQMCGGCALRSVVGSLVWCGSGLSRARVAHK